MKSKVIAWSESLKSAQTRIYIKLQTTVEERANLLLGVVGASYLCAGSIGISNAFAQGQGLAGDYRIYEAAELLISLVEGNAGSLIMVLAGIGAIVSAAFGAYRAATSLIVVAVGAFILRSLVDIFFNFGTTEGGTPAGVESVPAPSISRRYTLSRGIY